MKWSKGGNFFFFLTEGVLGEVTVQALIIPLVAMRTNLLGYILSLVIVIGVSQTSSEEQNILETDRNTLNLGIAIFSLQRVPYQMFRAILKSIRLTYSYLATNSSFIFSLELASNFVYSVQFLRAKIRVHLMNEHKYQ